MLIMTGVSIMLILLVLLVSPKVTIVALWLNVIMLSIVIVHCVVLIIMFAVNAFRGL